MFYKIKCCTRVRCPTAPLMQSREILIEETTRDFIHVLNLDTTKPFVLFENYGNNVTDEVGKIYDTDHLEYLKRIAVDSKRKDLLQLGVNERVQHILWQLDQEKQLK